MMKNASKASKQVVAFPHSKLKYAIAMCLKKEGYVADGATKLKKGHPVIEISLIYYDKRP